MTYHSYWRYSGYWPSPVRRHSKKKRSFELIPDSNLALRIKPERLALTIKRYLVSRYAVDEKRLVILGKGESDLYDQRKPKNDINRPIQFRPLS